MAVVCAVAVGAVFFVRARSHVSNPNTSANAPATTTTTDLGNGLTVTGPAGAHVTIVPDTGSPVPQPNLDHQVVYSPNVSPEVVAVLKTRIAAAVTILKKDPSRGDQWLELGFDYKTAGDYNAAEAVWLYLTKVSPNSKVAFQDLGDLYENFLKNYPKAESNYLAALKIDPRNIDIYRDLYMMYKYQYKTNTTAAADILVQGLQANPNNPDLLQLQKGQ